MSRALLPGVAVGTLCDIVTQNNKVVRAEIVGFSGTTALLMPLGDISGISEGSTVLPRPNDASLPVGKALLGRVVNASMEPIDGGPQMLLGERTAGEVDASARDVAPPNLSMPDDGNQSGRCHADPG